jgi:hypothetical protein
MFHANAPAVVNSARGLNANRICSMTGFLHRRARFPTLLAQLRARRHPIVGIAVWLVVLQAFLAGLATAPAAAGQANAPLHEAVICYGAGGSAGLPDGTSSDAAAHWNVCCTLCAFSTPATRTAAAMDVLEPAEASTPPLSSSFPIMIVRRAVRAGQSQGPPSSG